MRIKKVTFKNKYGEEITFTRHFPLYMEKINTFGVTGRFSTDSLIDSPGQFTSSFNVSGKTITAEFAFWNRRSDTRNLNKIQRVFTPLETGLLTVFDEDDMIYRTEAYPVSALSFQRTGNVLKWTTNFQADYPYWRKGYEMKVAEIPAGNGTDVYNHCMVPLPIVIVVPSHNSDLTFKNVSEETTVQFQITPYNGILTISTKDYTVKNESGENCNNVLYTNTELDQIFLRPGLNHLQCTQSSFTVRFWELVAGVM